MARLIDADELIKDNTWEWFDDWGNYTLAGQAIADAPTVDAVEVVRCKDCRFNVGNMENDPLDTTDYSDITCSYFMTDGMQADDFCSRGAKMDGGEKE